MRINNKNRIYKLLVFWIIKRREKQKRSRLTRIKYLSFKDSLGIVLSQKKNINI